MIKTDEIILYDNFSLADLLKESHSESQVKRNKIIGLIETLTPLIKNVTDASILAPIISNFMEVSVKNDDQLIKLAQVIQRIITSSMKNSGDNESLLSQSELDDLLKTVKDFDDDVKIPDSAGKYLNSGDNIDV